MNPIRESNYLFTIEMADEIIFREYFEDVNFEVNNKLFLKINK